MRLQQLHAVLVCRYTLAKNLTPNLLLITSPEKVDPRYIDTVMARWPGADFSYSGKGSGH